MRRNERLETAIRASSFGTVARLAGHVGVHYRNVESYVILERRPVDRNGMVKHDAAAICQALEAPLEDLFPGDFIDRPYRVLDSYEDGYGRRAVHPPQRKYFCERSLDKDQTETVFGLLEFADAIPPELARGFAEILIRDLGPDDFAALSAAHPEPGPDKPKAAAYRKALKRLNAPTSLKRFQALRRQAEEHGPERALADLEAELRAQNRVAITDDIRQQLVELSERTGMGAHALFDHAARRGIVPTGKGVSAQALDNALAGRTDTISEVLLEFAQRIWSLCDKLR